MSSYSSGVLVTALRVVEEHRRSTGLKRTEHAALAWLTGGDRSSSNLAGLLGLSKAGITNVVDRLVADDLAARLPDPHDRRRTIVRLTDNGRRALEGGAGHA